MRGPTSSLALCVTLVTAASACGGDDVPPVTIASPEAFVSAAHEAACDALFRCDAAGDLAQLRVVLGDASRCATLRAGTSALSWGNVSELPAAVRAARSRYDGAAAARCIARIRATCDVQHTLAELCADVFNGTVAVGGMCLRHEECAGSAWCDRGQATGMSACPGTCRARKATGDTCTVNEECAARAVGERAECFPDTTGTARCLPVRTGMVATEGGSCGHVIASGGGFDIPCASGLSCVLASGALAGTCRRPVAVGQACGEATACAPGAACTSTTTMRCTAIQVRRNANERCAAATFELCDPYARLVCRSGMCVSAGDGTMGATCGNMAIPADVQCNAGLYCEAGRCAARKADGQACTRDVECQSNACDGAMRVCAARTCR